MVQVKTLREHLLKHYYYCDGELIGPRGNVVGGNVGYKTLRWTIGSESESLLVHRAIFLMSEGYLPDLVDHIDQDPRNNVISNLRDANRSINTLNIDSFKRADSALPRGVDRSGNKYTARIKVNKVKLHLGTFDTIEEAANVAKLRRNEELNRGRTT